MKDLKIAGLRLPLFLIVSAVALVACLLKVIPPNMVGAFLLLILFGELLNLVGNHLPIIRSFFGGGPIVVIFGGAALVYFGIITPELKQVSDQFMKDPGGFLDFYIAALITGSILGMNRELLVKAAIRFLPTIIAGVLVAIGLTALVGPLVGIPSGQAIAKICIPIMGGGMGAGAVPISKVFAGALKIPADQILSELVPAVALGNAMAIVAGGLLDKLGKIKPNWTGNGQMMANGYFEVTDSDATGKDMTLSDYMVGIVIATAFFTWGCIVSYFFKEVFFFKFNLHPYAWMIISVAVVKALNIMPTEIEHASSGWYKFVAENFTAALMLGIGVSYTSMAQIISAFTIQYVVLCAIVVIGAIIGTALFGKLVGFNPIEAAITSGLCMANMGGTGDVAVLTASHRMELMPFAQISSRLGGAFIIFLASILVPIFF